MSGVNIGPTRPVMPEFNEYTELISSIWDSNVLTNNGELLKKFRKEAERYLGIKSCSLFVNGHLALDVGIKALGLKGEVITTPFTFASTIHAITMNNLTPVFCDIDSNTFSIDPSKIEELITENTSAIIGVHLFGIPSNVYAIEKIASRHGLKVIYDAAQAFGTVIDGKGIGTFGDLSMLSFHATKVFNSIEGGALVFENDELNYKLDLLKNFGISYKDDDISIEEAGVNGKMNEFQAAMGLLNLKGVDTEIEKRRSIAELYIEEISKKTGLSVPEYLPNIKYNHSYFPIMVNKELYGKSRDELHTSLKEKGINTRKLYSLLCPDYSCYKDMGFRGDIPVARRISECILDLPIYGSMSKMEIDCIISNL